MIKIKSELETKINGKDHRYQCDPDSAIPDCKEALFQFLKYIGQLEDNAKVAQAQAEQPKCEENPVEAVVEPEQPIQE